MQHALTRYPKLVAMLGGFALAGTLGLAPAAASQAGYASSTITLSPGAWKIDTAKSHFGPNENRMVLEKGSLSGAGKNTASSTFVVIANGKVYLATAPEALDAGGVRKVDYARWRNMKLLQVGENAQSIDLCNFACQSGKPEDRLTLTFRSVNGGMSEMGNLVVYNQR